MGCEKKNCAEEQCQLERDQIFKVFTDQKSKPFPSDFISKQWKRWEGTAQTTCQIKEAIKSHSRATLRQLPLPKKMFVVLLLSV
jgi:hypothetical protein